MSALTAAPIPAPTPRTEDPQEIIDEMKQLKTLLPTNQQAAEAYVRSVGKESATILGDGLNESATALADRFAIWWAAADQTGIDGVMKIAFDIVDADTLGLLLILADAIIAEGDQVVADGDALVADANYQDNQVWQLAGTAESVWNDFYYFTGCAVVGSANNVLASAWNIENHLTGILSPRWYAFVDYWPIDYLIYSGDYYNAYGDANSTLNEIFDGMYYILGECSAH